MQNFPAATGPNQSYQNQSVYNKRSYDDTDLYEFEPETSNAKAFVNSTSSKVKGIFNALSGQDNGEHNVNQYRKDIMDNLCMNINQTLIVPKAFYFFFFAAFGSLFPMMAIYFKQMAMSPTQVGILFGLRPFVEFLSAPFWANIGERWRKGKLILFSSMTCWIVFTLAMGFIKPPVHSCLMIGNETHIIMDKPRVGNSLKNPSKRNLENLDVKLSDEPRSTGEYEGFILNRKKRQSEKNTEIVKDGRKFEIITHTKIISVKKNRSTPSTVVKQATLETRENGLEQAKQGFDRMPPKNDFLAEKEVNKTIKQTVNRVADEISKNTNIGKASSEVKHSVSSVVNEIVSQIETDSKKSQAQMSTRAQTKAQADNYFGSLSLEKEKTKLANPNESHSDLLKPTLMTSIVYHKDDVRRVFLIFLFLLLIGEFFSAPAITLADSCTLKYLGSSRVDLYGRQRMFGSIGWALAMFCVGLLLDRSKAFIEHPCGKAGPDERNYTVCFAIYSVLMGCAFAVATQFKFTYGDEQIPLKSFSQSGKQNLQRKNGQNSESFDRKELVNEDDDSSDEPYSTIDTAMPQARPPKQIGGGMRKHSVPVPDFTQNSFATTEEGHERKIKFQHLLSLCKSFKQIAFLFMVWFMGIGVGLVFTFLFWHLQDLGGSPALYGIASVINHMSELMAYFFVQQIVRKFGYIRIFYAGLLGNCIRFIYVAVLEEPYWILPFEFIQGITHALVWATATAYFAQSVPEELKSTAQGILQGLHFGLGRGCGALLGGVIVDYFGSKATFLCYGIASLLVLIGYIALNHFTMEISLAHTTEPMQNNNDTDIDVLSGDSNYSLGKREHALHNASFPISPHGVPASNPNWSKEFMPSNKGFF